jgi:uracil-DNA glycosylase
VLPSYEDVLAAFGRCPFDRVKVAIVGQEPYHVRWKAHGLAFGVHEGLPPPQSLVNIFLELAEEYRNSFRIPQHGCLEQWAKQGILLLNAVLTVVAGAGGSHQNLGWQTFTTAVIAALNAKPDRIVFLAWGKIAQKICTVVDLSKHSLLKCGHPSPRSTAYFAGCGHFVETNRILAAAGQTPINWNAIND